MKRFFYLKVASVFLAVLISQLILPSTALMSSIPGDGGPATAAALAQPTGIAIDGANNLLIIDTFNNAIRKVDTSKGIISTVAGNIQYVVVTDGGLAIEPTFTQPHGITVDTAGNVFIADTFNNVVRKIDAASGNVSTIAGNGTAGFSGDGGPATAASLNQPYAVAIDGAGNLFIADTVNNVVRKIDAMTGNISTVAGNGSFGLSGDGGPATAASFNLPYGLAIDKAGNLFIADTFNNNIRKVDAMTGNISTVAGNGQFGPLKDGDGGPATAASLNLPFGVAVDKDGNLFIADTFNSAIRKVDATTAIITTIAGNNGPGFGGDNGPATAATLDQPNDIAIDGAGNLFIADTINNVVRKIDATTGTITTVAGTGSFTNNQ
jgi:sugar lactone lactonase YvrE